MKLPTILTVAAYEKTPFKIIITSIQGAVTTAKGLCKEKKSEITMEVGGSRSLGFFLWKIVPK